MQTENIYPAVPENAPGQAGHAEAQRPASAPVFSPQVQYGSAPVPAQPMIIPEPPAPAALTDPGTDKPIPVLEVLSVRGVEYGMMTIVLWIGALTLAWVVLNMLNGSRGFNYVVVPTSALVICVPIFGWFFLRLKKAELADPGLRFDPSKRRWSQITQIIAYTAVLVNLIYFVYVLLQHASSSHGSSIPKALANLAVVLVIAGGVLAYYWRDEHRLIK